MESGDPRDRQHADRTSCRTQQRLPTDHLVAGRDPDHRRQSRLEPPPLRRRDTSDMALAIVNWIKAGFQADSFSDPQPPVPDGSPSTPDPQTPDPATLSAADLSLALSTSLPASALVGGRFKARSTITISNT